MGWPGISAELSDQLSNLFLSGDDFQLAYSDYLRSCLGKLLIQQHDNLG